MIIGWIFVGILAVSAIVLLSGRGSFLIAGYNTSSKEEKEKYDEKKLCRTAGIILSVITIATAFLLISISNSNSTFVICAVAIYTVIDFVTVGIAIFYMNKKCLKINNIHESDVAIGIKNVASSPDFEKEKKKKKAVLIGSGAFSVVFIAAIIVSMIISARPTVYTIKNGTLNISTAFGETIKLSDISKVQLKNSMPDNLSKINGLGLGTILKGKFEANGNDLNVYVDTSKSPFIYIYTKSGLTIINDQTKSETQALYQKLK